MSSKICLILLLGALTGCSFFLKDEVEKRETIQMGDESACLSGVSASLGAYMRKEADFEKAEEVFRCIETSIESFANKTSGESPGVYSRASLKHFIEKHVLSGGNFDAEVLAALMRLKASLVGGDEDHLTRLELDRIRGFLGTFRTLVKKLNDKRDIYALSAVLSPVSKASVKHLDDAILILNEAARDLSVELRGLGSVDFNLGDLETILKASKKSVGLADYVGLFKSLKSILTKPQAEVVSANEWSVLVERAAQTYGIFLRYRYLLSKE